MKRLTGSLARPGLSPNFAIPMHYDANPLGKGTPQEYIKALGSTPAKVSPLNPGDTVEY